MYQTQEKTPGRLYQFDLIRLALVLLALASHFMSSQHWDTNLPANNFLVIKMITRPAMPCLLIIFGFMIEHVYARRWKSKGSKVVLFKLTDRALVCYLAFVTLTIVGAIGGYNAWWKSIANIFLLFPATHANLFKYYTILIPIIFCLTWLRIKFGWKYKMGVIALIIGLAEAINFLHLPVPGVIKHMAGLMLGIDNVWGPSIAHALILVLFGELAANARAEKKPSLPFYTLAFMVTGSVILVSERILRMGPAAFINAIIDYDQFRAHNSYVYFAYGILALILWLGISTLVLSFMSEKSKQRISYFGSNTITLFYYGNLLILITPYLFRDVLTSSLLLVTTLAAALASIPAMEWAESHFTLVIRLNHAIGYMSNLTANLIMRFIAPPMVAVRTGRLKVINRGKKIMAQQKSD